MSGWAIAGLIALVVLLDVMIVGAIFSALGVSWRKFAAKWPPVAPGQVHERRHRQGLALGSYNTGGCFTIERDAKHIHATPNAFGRLIRVTPISIPLARIDKCVPKMFGHCELAIGSDRLTVPRWCVAELITSLTAI